MASRVNTTDQFVNATHDALDQVDMQRAEQLEFTNKLLALKDKAQQKEKERLTKKYGADHPEVKKLGLRLAYNEQLFEAVETNIKESKTPNEPFPATSWRVHGYVYDAKGRPCDKVTVLFLDEKEQPIDTLPYACTNSEGYYAITVSREQIPDGRTGLLLGLSLPNSKKPEPVPGDPMFAVAGQIIYRDIILGDEAKCAPPFTEEGPK